MKKGLFITIFALLLLLFACSATASAQQLTQLPVMIIEEYSYPYPHTTQGVLESFEVFEAYPISDQTNEFHYAAEFTPIDGCPNLVMHCYDEGGYLIKTLNFNPDKNFIEVPRYTATVEIDTKNPYDSSESYLYRGSTCTMYAPGRSLQTTTLLASVYESLGWSYPTTMYAPENGEWSRTIEVSPFEVEAYRKVGWYTYADAFYQIARDLYNSAMSSKDYESACRYAECLYGTEYEPHLYDMRSNAINKWRKQCGKPMGLINAVVGEESGTSTVTLNFRNLSSKKIIAFRVDFDAQDVFGAILNSNSHYYCDNTNLGVASRSSYIWKLRGTSNARFVKNINVYEVVYEDGTRWYGK